MSNLEDKLNAMFAEKGKKEQQRDEHMRKDVEGRKRRHEQFKNLCNTTFRRLFEQAAKVFETKGYYCTIDPREGVVTHVGQVEGVPHFVSLIIDHRTEGKKYQIMFRADQPTSISINGKPFSEPASGLLSMPSLATPTDEDSATAQIAYFSGLVILGG
jgi:hypothetical protein